MFANHCVGYPLAKDRLGLRNSKTMNSTLINPENVIEVLEADRYGHPKKAHLMQLRIPANHNWVMAPQADRFGHISVDKGRSGYRSSRSSPALF
jgi:hypothetical protein